MKIRFLIPIFLTCVFFNTYAQRKAVIIILDGIPADVVEKVNTPVLDEIASQGGYTRSYQGGKKGGYSQSPTISAVGYANVITGTWANKHNVWDNNIKQPNYNYWNVFRIAKSVNSKIQTAIYSSWTDNRTKLVGEGLPSAGNFKFDYAYDGLELDTLKIPHTKDRTYMFNIDELISKEAATHITEQAPDLSWVYLEFTDDMGHMFGDSPQFTEAIKKADAQVGRIWNAIKEREEKFGEEWMIVITTDHGRDAATGKGHGGQSERERTTWIVTNAKALNTHFKNAATVDIAPSVLSFMKLEMPQSIREEFDGTSFLGDVSISNLTAAKEGKKATLTWNAMKDKGMVEIKVSTTNNFKEGKADRYKSMGKAEISSGKYTFTLPESYTGFYKIIVVSPDNTLNRWIVKK
ncbi:MAG: alkaline phosphatase family protein [Cyclobacteriaceae bacterium]|jgi:membrane-anchored protein YejM (alkaline phosphatase superfamily)|nr:alkaline phosphatase family protein [Cyclobacteriaceae bacterium]